MKRIRIYILFILVLTSSCKKWVEVGAPPNQLTSTNIYDNDETVAAVMTNIYANIGINSLLYGTTLNSLSLGCGLTADELSLYGNAANANAMLVQYYQNALLAGTSNSPGPNIWNSCYNSLYTVNAALEQLPVATGLDPAVRQQLTGEAKFLRSFFYFWLTNIYGDVPLALTSNYIVNQALARSSQAKVYQQIIHDLQDAENLMSDHYVGMDAVSSTTERTRPNKWVAAAMLARAYLYNQQWDSAENASTRVIQNSTLFGLDSLNAVFLKNSTETIWQIQPVNVGWNTEDARVFILPAGGPNASQTAEGAAFPVYISPQLLAAFEPNDARRSHWVDSVVVGGSAFYYAYKYKSAVLNSPVTEYGTVLRLGEQYLIRAEARANLNNISGSQSDLNTIRTRANLPPTTAADPASLVTAVLNERQVELFTEWGHRWFDLKRTNTINSVMTNVSPTKGESWSNNWQLFPIPLYDITLDPNIIQNAGY